MNADTSVECIVEYDYQAEMNDELTLRVGDVVTEVDKMEGGWWKGRLGDKVGMFPDNFVKVLPGGSKTKPVEARNDEILHQKNKKWCRVLFSYEPVHEDELELKVDQLIEFLAEVEDGWWRGRLGTKMGVFPSNFVEMCNSNDCDIKTAGDAMTVDAKNKKNSLGPLFSNGLVLNTASNRRNSSGSSTDANINDPSKKTNGKILDGSKRTPPDTAPRLPPKRVKEQCLVLFPYTAQNEDELTLEEGQIVQIITKEVEDKGWWKGELDGRVGVFPDNFVKLVSNVLPDEVKDKKPLRPPTHPELLSKKSSSNKQLSSLGGSPKGSDENLPNASKSRSASEDRISSKSSSLEKLTDKFTSSKRAGSSEKLSKLKAPKIGDITKRLGAQISEKLEKKSEKKTSAPMVLVTEGKKKSSTGGSSTAIILGTSPTIETSEKSERKVSESGNPEELDGVQRREKLSHLTADRVKAPKRRPPSSIFMKENIPDVTVDPFEGDVIDKNGVRENGDKTPDKPEPEPLYNGLSNGLPEALSKRLQSPTVDGQVSSAEVVLRKPGSAKSGPAPVAPSSSTAKEEPAKPSWLEELSRKQANRKSGIFGEEKKEKPEPPQQDTKPSIPSKPSQVKEEVRKSLGNFARRPASFGAAASQDKLNIPKVNKRPQSSENLETDRPAKPATADPSPAVKKAESTKPARPSLPTVLAKSGSAVSVNSASDVSQRSSPLLPDTAATAAQPSRTTGGHSAANLGRPDRHSFAKPEKPIGDIFGPQVTKPQKPSESFGQQKLLKTEKSELLSRRERSLSGGRREKSGKSESLEVSKHAAVAPPNSAGAAVKVFDKQSGDGGGGVDSEKSVKTPAEPVIGWKPFVGANVDKESVDATNSTKEDRVDKTWEQEMSDLRAKMESVQTEFSSEVAKLRKDLEEEKRARIKLESEVQSLRRLLNK